MAQPLPILYIFWKVARYVDLDVRYPNPHRYITLGGKRIDLLKYANVYGTPGSERSTILSGAVELTAVGMTYIRPKYPTSQLQYTMNMKTGRTAHYPAWSNELLNYFEALPNQYAMIAGDWSVQPSAPSPPPPVTHTAPRPPLPPPPPPPPPVFYRPPPPKPPPKPPVVLLDPNGIHNNKVGFFFSPPPPPKPRKP